MNNYSGTNIGLYIFECVMAVLYLVIAYTLLMTDYFKEAALPKGIRIGLGVLFMLYGIFRIFRAIRKGMKNRENG